MAIQFYSVSGKHLISVKSGKSGKSKIPFKGQVEARLGTCLVIDIGHVNVLVDSVVFSSFEQEKPVKKTLLVCVRIFEIIKKNQRNLYNVDTFCLLPQPCLTFCTGQDV